MGIGMGKMSQCCAGSAGEISRRHDIAFIMEEQLHNGLGHSFCYIRPEPARLSSSKVHSLYDPVAAVAIAKTTTFRSISGASVSANVSTAPSTALIDSNPHSSAIDRASTFESSDLFASLPLQPVPRTSSSTFPGSGPMERGFLSGPIERGFLSGPLYSGPMEKEKGSDGNGAFQRSLSHSSLDKTEVKPKRKSFTFIKNFKRAISHKIKGFVLDKESSETERNIVTAAAIIDKTNSSSNESSNHVYDHDDDGDDGEFSMKSQNLQWAQGKAGEDRMHIVISEEKGWVFVGIYDGFNGPDAPDHLVSYLYNAVHEELRGLLWNDRFESDPGSDSPTGADGSRKRNRVSDKENCPLGNGDLNLESNSKRKHGKNLGKWKWEWDREKLELDRKLKESNEEESINHPDVLKALSEALRKTEDAYLEMVMVNPELALIGSCVLVMLMKGEDVYLMSVGDSRAILARKPEPKVMHEIEAFPNLMSIQLTMDHSTIMEEEVERIRKDHPDDDSAVVNDRVKGYLKVTRAFGAGFLKQPKWNDALLEMFRINYVGTSPYITCSPSLYHYKLGPHDRFLILSSDGLYQYFTNEEAVSEVESFINSFPEGDPAQHLIEEVLFRAAKKAGMDFHELLDIPNGDRRRYHDDVSVIIISLEGRIWRSSVNTDLI